MAPPKGYKKGYIKHPETGEYIDPRELEVPEEKKKKIIVKKKNPTKNQKALDDLGSATKNVEDPAEYAIIVVTWKDQRGRQRNTQYVMSDLTINENVHETFKGSKKTTHINLNLDGTVLEKI
jgi:hypothetical protein